MKVAVVNHIKGGPPKGIFKAIVYISDTLNLKLREESGFTGKIEFIIHCKDGGIGNIEAFSKNKIK